MQTRFTPEYVEYLAYKFKDGTLSDEEKAESKHGISFKMKNSSISLKVRFGINRSWVTVFMTVSPANYILGQNKTLDFS